jgi:alkylation response protein AidB-like acyl-CoA dehydrogenase
VGGARAILEIAARYANKRKAFGLTIKSFQGVNFRIAEIVPGYSMGLSVLA